MKRFTESEKWRDKWFRALSPSNKFLYLYILDECDPAGVIDLDIDLAAFQIGFAVDIEDLLDTSNGRIEVLPNGKYWLTKFCDFQYANGVSKTAKVHSKVRDSIKKNDLTVKYQDDSNTYSKPPKKVLNTPAKKEKPEPVEKPAELFESDSSNGSGIENIVGGWYGRKPTTQWSARELAAFKKLKLKKGDDFDLMTRFYGRSRPGTVKDDYRRRDVLTLLNNWTGELDRARQWEAENPHLSGQKDTRAPKAPEWSTNPLWRKAAGMTLDNETNYTGEWHSFPTARVTEMLSILKDLDTEA